MRIEEQIEAIRKKLEAGEQITREEEDLYMQQVFGFDTQEIQRVVAINENKDPNVIID